MEEPHGRVPALVYARLVKQDVIINIEMEFDGAEAIEKDEIEYTIDYKSITKKIISEIEEGNYNLIEKIAGDVMRIVIEDGRVLKATVKIDKPGAVRYADSVSVTHTETR